MITILFCTTAYYFLFYNGQTPSNSNAVSAEVLEPPPEEKTYIKWFEFKPSHDVLNKTMQLDITSHNKNEPIKYNWIELISYLACKYGNDFKKFKQTDLDKLVVRLKNGELMEEITKDMKLYSYYYEGYSSVLSQFVGEYELNSNKNYGLKAFHPLAQNYNYSHYDDFGNSRSYGYKRLHLGNDLMGSIGTPVIAVESGIIEAARMESIWWMENWYS